MLTTASPELLRWYLANSQTGQPERYREATRAETYYCSLQYENLQPWEAIDQALHARKPRIIVPLYREIVDAIERFVWGGARFPELVIEPTQREDDPLGDDEVGPSIDQDQAKALTTFLRRLVQVGRLQRTAREFSRVAMVGRSAACILGARGGWLTTHVEPGKHCKPTFDPSRPRALAGLEIMYIYPQEEEVSPGRWSTQLYWYRRKLTTEADYIFKPVPFRAGVLPEWQIDRELSVNHHLGFCPAVWARPLGDCSDAIDGKPLIDPALYPALDEINYTVSLKNRAVQYGTDPVTLRAGVEEGERLNVVKGSRIVDVPKEGDLRLVETSGTGAQRAGEHLVDLEQRIRDACSYVKANPEMAVGKLSGPILQFLYAPMLALASDLRQDLGEDTFVDLLNLALRLCATTAERGEDVFIPGAGKATEMLRQVQLQGDWLPFAVAIQWPPFVDLGEEERGQRVAYTVAAKREGIISSHTATEHVAPIFGVEDAEAEHEEIETEQAEQAEYGPLGAVPPKGGQRPMPGQGMPGDGEEPDEGEE